MSFVSAGATGEEDELTPGPVRGYRLTAPSMSACAGFATIDTRASKHTFIQTRYGVGYSLEPVEK
jgi:hypothetical protein